jgi:hypothetical protein
MERKLLTIRVFWDCFSWSLIGYLAYDALKNISGDSLCSQSNLQVPCVLRVSGESKI